MMKKTTYAATGVFALLALTACGSNNSATPAPETTTVTVTAEASAPASSAATTSMAASSAPASSNAAAANTSAAYTNDDVNSAIDAALGQYPNGVVVSFDADNNGSTFDVNLVDGETVHELRIDRNGNVTVEESEMERNSDDVAEAQEARVTARQAVGSALENRDNVLIDSLELERNNGTLEWQVDLDDASGKDSAKIYINAADGSMTER